MEGLFILLAFALGVVAAIAVWVGRRGRAGDSGVHPENVARTPPTRPR